MSKKAYVEPAVTRVVLEDKQVVAMAACNGFLTDPQFQGSSIQGDQVVDQFGNPLLTYDPSL